MQTTVGTGQYKGVPRSSGSHTDLQWGGPQGADTLGPSVCVWLRDGDVRTGPGPGRVRGEGDSGPSRWSCGDAVGHQGVRGVSWPKMGQPQE